MKKLLSSMMLALILLCSGCLLYGSPDSPLVDFWGRDMPDYIDATNKSLPEPRLDHDYLVLMNFPNKDLALLNTRTGESRIVLKSEEPSHFATGGMILSDRHYVAFIEHRAVAGHQIFTFHLYNYDSGTMVGRPCPLKDDLGFMQNPIIKQADSDNSIHVFLKKLGSDLAKPKIKVMKNTFDVGENGITQRASDEVSNEAEASQSGDSRFGYEYITGDGETLRLLVVSPYSDYLPANYKTKYNGTYICRKNAKTNLRISTDHGMSLYIQNPIWMNDGAQVVYNGYIFDTAGKSKPRRLMNGTVLCITSI